MYMLDVWHKILNRDSCKVECRRDKIQIKTKKLNDKNVLYFI